MAQDVIFVGGGGETQREAQTLSLKLANRHGLIAGATGTGKTVTLQVLAEGFSAAGVPVFLTDVKGDLSGLAHAGGQDKHKASFEARAQMIGQRLEYRAFPVIFWDLFGQKGHPVRTTLTEMGPVLLSRLLELSDVQEGVMMVVFRLADDENMALLDLKDLQALLSFVFENASDISARYGLVSGQSIAAIQRRLLSFETEGGALFFGEPALDLADMMRLTPQGEGVISILAADRLINAPRLYATFLLWLLSELFETLPEVGDLDKPRLVFFFDEAHLLFNDAPKALIAKIEQVARLIRSKGVGIYFVTQNPADVPDSVLSQLGNRVQHALRAFTAKDQKNLRLAAQTYRENPRFDIENTLQELGIGEAVTSFLQPKGVPGVAERTVIGAPSSFVGPIDAQVYAQVMQTSPVAGKYDTLVDRESAWEILHQRRDPQAEAVPNGAREFSRATRYGSTKAAPVKPSPKSNSDHFVDSFTSSFAKQLGNKGAQAVVRGVLGTLFPK